MWTSSNCTVDGACAFGRSERRDCRFGFQRQYIEGQWLEAVEHVADISSRLVVNKAALKTKYALLNPIIQAFENAAKAV